MSAFLPVDGPSAEHAPPFAEVHAWSGGEKNFVNDFVAVWDKVMNWIAST